MLNRASEKRGIAWKLTGDRGSARGRYGLWSGPGSSNIGRAFVAGRIRQTSTPGNGRWTRRTSNLCVHYLIMEQGAAFAANMTASSHEADSQLAQ